MSSRFLGEKRVYATIPDGIVFVCDLLSFKDFTPGATQWKWEFGNGDSITQRKGGYRYSKSGKYLIRLALNNNPEWRAFFSVTVVDTLTKPAWKIIYMDGPERAFQGENVQFRIIGVESQVNWYMNEVPVGFCEENTCTYKFSLPGNYVAKVMIDGDTAVYHHAITILDSSMHHIII